MKKRIANTGLLAVVNEGLLRVEDTPIPRQITSNVGHSNLATSAVPLSFELEISGGTATAVRGGGTPGSLNFAKQEAASRIWSRSTKVRLHDLRYPRGANGQRHSSTTPRTASNGRREEDPKIQEGGTVFRGVDDNA